MEGLRASKGAHGCGKESQRAISGVNRDAVHLVRVLVVLALDAIVVQRRRNRQVDVFGRDSLGKKSRVVREDDVQEPEDEHSRDVASLSEP